MYKGREDYEIMRDFILKVESFFKKVFKNGKWVSEKPFSIDGVPSFQLSHKTFLSSLNIERDLKTNFITIAFEHVSPHVAKEFLEKIIIEVSAMPTKPDIKIQGSISIFF